MTTNKNLVVWSWDILYHRDVWKYYKATQDFNGALHKFYIDKKYGVELVWPEGSLKILEKCQSLEVAKQVSKLYYHSLLCEFEIRNKKESDMDKQIKNLERNYFKDVKSLLGK
jgi:hypothetical protein